jgi:hypothetical protein
MLNIYFPRALLPPFLPLLGLLGFETGPVSVGVQVRDGVLGAAELSLGLYAALQRGWPSSSRNSTCKWSCQHARDKPSVVSQSQSSNVC